jgi:hypothetical protein
VPGGAGAASAQGSQGPRCARTSAVRDDQRLPGSPAAGTRRGWVARLPIRRTVIRRTVVWKESNGTEAMPSKRQSEWPAPRASSVAVSAAVSAGNSSDRIESVANAHRFTNTDRLRRRAEPGAAAAALQSCAPLVACPVFGHDAMGRCVECGRLGRLPLARALHHLLVACCAATRNRH